MAALEMGRNMSFTVMLSPDARKYLDSLDKKRVKNIKTHLKELEKNPFIPRAGCDIDIVGGSGRPPMYRLRIGNFRAVYFVDGKSGAIYVTNLFQKKRDSAYGEN